MVCFFQSVEKCSHWNFFRLIYRRQLCLNKSNGKKITQWIFTQTLVWDPGLWIMSGTDKYRLAEEKRTYTQKSYLRKMFHQTWKSKKDMMDKLRSVVGNAIKRSFLSDKMIWKLVYSNTKSASSKSVNNRLGTKEIRETESFYLFFHVNGTERFAIDRRQTKITSANLKWKISREVNELWKRVKRGKTRMFKLWLVKTITERIEAQPGTPSKCQQPV